MTNRTNKIRRASWVVDEPVIVVDEHDRSLGEISRCVAHEGAGVLHRAFAVFLIADASYGADAGKVLLCRRSAHKVLWAGYWTDSCSGHPLPGEDVVAAAERRSFEELGARTALIDRGYIMYSEDFGDRGCERELCHVLTGEVADFYMDVSEVSETRWITIDELSTLAVCSPTDWAPWLIAAVQNIELR